MTTLPALWIVRSVGGGRDHWFENCRKFLCAFAEGFRAEAA